MFESEKYSYLKILLVWCLIYTPMVSYGDPNDFRQESVESTDRPEPTQNEFQFEENSDLDKPRSEAEMEEPISDDLADEKAQNMENENSHESELSREEKKAAKKAQREASLEQEILTLETILKEKTKLSTFYKDTLTDVAAAKYGPQLDLFIEAGKLTSLAKNMGVKLGHLENALDKRMRLERLDMQFDQLSQMRPSNASFFIDAKNNSIRTAKITGYDSAAFWLAGTALSGLVNEGPQFYTWAKNEFVKHGLEMGESFQESMPWMGSLLDPRWLQTEYEHLTSVQGLMNFYLFIASNQQYNKWTGRLARNLRLDAASSKGLQSVAKGLMAGVIGYSGMGVASAFSQFAMEFGTMIKDCTFSKIADAHHKIHFENGLPKTEFSRLQNYISSCDDLYGRMTSSKYYKHWVNTTLVGLIPAAIIGNIAHRVSVKAFSTTSSALGRNLDKAIAASDRKSTLKLIKQAWKYHSKALSSGSKMARAATVPTETILLGAEKAVRAGKTAAQITLVAVRTGVKIVRVAGLTTATMSPHVLLKVGGFFFFLAAEQALHPAVEWVGERIEASALLNNMTALNKYIEIANKHKWKDLDKVKIYYAKTNPRDMCRQGIDGRSKVGTDIITSGGSSRYCSLGGLDKILNTLLKEVALDGKDYRAYKMTKANTAYANWFSYLRQVTLRYDAAKIFYHKFTEGLKTHKLRKGSISPFRAVTPVFFEKERFFKASKEDLPLTDEGCILLPNNPSSTGKCKVAVPSEGKAQANTEAQMDVEVPEGTQLGDEVVEGLSVAEFSKLLPRDIEAVDPMTALQFLDPKIDFEPLLNVSVERFSQLTGQFESIMQKEFLLEEGENIKDFLVGDEVEAYKVMQAISNNTQEIKKVGFKNIKNSFENLKASQKKLKELISKEQSEAAKESTEESEAQKFTQNVLSQLPANWTVEDKGRALNIKIVEREMRTIFDSYMKANIKNLDFDSKSYSVNHFAALTSTTGAVTGAKIIKYFSSNDLKDWEKGIRLINEFADPLLLSGMWFEKRKCEKNGTISMANPGENPEADEQITTYDNFEFDFNKDSGLSCLPLLAYKKLGYPRPISFGELYMEEISHEIQTAYGVTGVTKKEVANHIEVKNIAEDMLGHMACGAPNNLKQLKYLRDQINKDSDDNGQFRKRGEKEDPKLYKMRELLYNTQFKKYNELRNAPKIANLISNDFVATDMYFTPPKITNLPESICGRFWELDKSIWDDEWTVNYNNGSTKTYTNFIEMVSNHIDPDALDMHNWWLKNVFPLATTLYETHLKTFNHIRNTLIVPEVLGEEQKGQYTDYQYVTDGERSFFLPMAQEGSHFATKSLKQIESFSMGEFIDNLSALDVAWYQLDYYFEKVLTPMYLGLSQDKGEQAKKLYKRSLNNWLEVISQLRYSLANFKNKENPFTETSMYNLKLTLDVFKTTLGVPRNVVEEKALNLRAGIEKLEAELKNDPVFIEYKKLQRQAEDLVSTISIYNTIGRFDFGVFDKAFDPSKHISDFVYVVKLNSHLKELSKKDLPADIKQIILSAEKVTEKMDQLIEQELKKEESNEGSKIAEYLKQTTLEERQITELQNQLGMEMLYYNELITKEGKKPLALPQLLSLNPSQSQKAVLVQVFNNIEALMMEIKSYRRMFSDIKSLNSDDVLSRGK